MKRIAVIGGGISGLSVAHHTEKAGTRVTLFDASTSVGGNIQTITKGPYTYECGPNSLMANGEIFELIDDLGLGDKIVETRPAAKKRYILRDGKPIALPGGAVDSITTKAFSVGGRLRLFKEPFISSKTSQTESVYSFIERRLGREMADYAIDPFVSGIYAGDPKRLSLTSAFPRFYNLELTGGSLIKGALFGKRVPKKAVPVGAPRMFSFTGGMQHPHQWSCGGVEGRSPQLSCRGVSKQNGGYSVNGESFDAVALCTPAPSAARLIESVDAEAAKEISGVYYPPVAVVYASYKRDQVGVAPDGFGILIPGLEKPRHSRGPL